MDLGFPLYPGGNALIHPVAVMGGGLAGLAAAIELRKKGHAVIVFEKAAYPRHKVCGEYVSNESRSYLESLCPEIFKENLPAINRFRLTSTGQHTYDTKLDTGGFGISRYLLEHRLVTKAKELGVIVKTMTKVTSVMPIPAQNLYAVTTYQGKFFAKLVLNATASPAPVQKMQQRFIGVKYHIKLQRERDRIEIHSFSGGYCGISAIENDNNCLCYLAEGRLLREHHNSIPALEKNVLRQNKFLAAIFARAEFLPGFPVTMSGFEFKVNKSHEEGRIFIGDAAGKVSPLTGNGMSNALRSAHFLAGYAHDYLSGKIDKNRFLALYTRRWNSEFATRINTGRYLQRIAGSTRLTRTSIRLFNLVPVLGSYVIRKTHGKSF